MNKTQANELTVDSNSQVSESKMKPHEVIRISHLDVASIHLKDDSTLIKRPLYHKCELSALRGECVVILGASGTGKSLLSHLILNIESPLSESLVFGEMKELHRASIKLSLRPDQPSIDLLSTPYPSALKGELGVMFQSLGLFEDLSVEENLRFANDHSRSPMNGLEWITWKKELLIKLRLSEAILNQRVNRLSGGERQRVALGRLLAFQPKVMILDEPTSALDSGNTTQIVEMIHKSHQETQAILTLIITHDYEAFLDVADRVWFLNQHGKFEDHLPPKSLKHYREALKVPKEDESTDLARREYIQHIARLHDLRLSTAFKRAWQHSRQILETLKSPWRSVYLRRFFGEVLWSALPFHLVSSFVLGAVATYFTFNLKLGHVSTSSGQVLEVSRFILPTFFEQMLSGFSVAMWRAIVPIFTCFCVAARSGTAVTAYLCEMRDPQKRQWDALGNLGVLPFWFFMPLLIIVFSTSCFVLSYLSFWSASLASLLTSLTINPLSTLHLWYEHYSRLLEPYGYLWFEGIEMVFIKTTLSGLIIAIVSSICGSRPNRNTLDVMRSLSRANVLSVTFTLILFFIILLWESGSWTS